METVIMFGVIAIYMFLFFMMVVGISLSYYLLSVRQNYKTGVAVFLATVFCLSLSVNIIFN